MTEEKKGGQVIDQAVLAELLSTFKGMNSSGSERRRSRDKEPEYEIESVSIPVLIETRREKVRTFINCKGKFKSEDDIQDLIDELVDAGFPVEIWEKKDRRERDRGGRSSYQNDDRYRGRR